MFQHFLQDATTLFVVIDPVGLVPVFIAITQKEPQVSRQRIALLGVGISAIILFAFMIGGQTLLSALDISLPAFKIAGGLLLLIVGLRMVLNEDEHSASTDPESSIDLAVFPLATPLIAGPGGIMTVVLLTDNTKFGAIDQAITSLALMTVLIFTYVALLFANLIQKALGRTGVNVITRILGLLVAALATEIILGGIQDYFLTL
ncbi:multiple antibiotic resistance (MarC)-related protein [Halothece sp. PCC 7418]|uniref:MarC family protein n=1 Tax=Halothece sp. (strain PCC 7418) TaxID=65093 RepID=UPI0002A07FC1|nr:MarC family protein [Halothece sp. PCC 7418]AFZ44710.1 multiple antibiotic resistance (MarC)-related protein [Halothece sp. PCC 7418]